MNFQQPLLQFSVSHDPSEIFLICWFATQEILFSLLEKSLLIPNIWTVKYIQFIILFLFVLLFYLYFLFIISLHIII